jgi:cytochrome c biogenesis protein CcdA
MSAPRAVVALLLVLALVLPCAAVDDGWVFAYRPGCGDCDRTLPAVQAWQANHTAQAIEYLDLNAGPDAVLRFEDLANRSGTRPHIPALFLGDDRAVMGGTEIRAFLENAAAPANATGTAPPPLTPLAVVGAGLVDGINPCAFAVLALLLGALAASGTRRRVLVLGGAYTLGVFACYLAAGFGIVAVVGAAGFAPAFRLAAGTVAIVLGVAVLAASVLQRRELAPAITARGKERIAGWLEKAPAAGPVAALALGIGVALVELPCTGGVYLGVLGLLAGGAMADALPLLVLYNLCFVLPLALIVGGVALGLAPSAVDEWRGARRRAVLGVSGFVMVALGVAVLAQALL